MRRIAVVCVAVLAAFAVFATVRQDASSETYSQVVDNSDEDRFAASKSWKKSDSGKGINGDDYLFARPAKKGAHALFEVAIPADGEYAVYVRWPDVRGLNDRTPVGVETAYGTKWTKVDQRKDGGAWVRIGEFEMRRDEEFPVRISHNTKGKGNVAADAVKIERVSSYEEPAADRTEAAAPAEGTRTTSATGAQVVAEARKYIGTRYLYGRPSVCKPYKTMDCTCLTRTVYLKYGKSLSHLEAAQYRNGRPVAFASLRPGDLVFHNEFGDGISHVSIYAGRDIRTGERMIIHASDHFAKVVRSQMKYIPGYAGARRILP